MGGEKGGGGLTFWGDRGWKGLDASVLSLVK